MAGRYERCGARTRKGADHFYQCNRKAGHAGEHVDSKESPAARWHEPEDA